MFAPDLRTGKHTFSLHCEKSSSELRIKTKKRKVFDRFSNLDLLDDQAKFLTQSKRFPLYIFLILPSLYIYSHFPKFYTYSPFS